MLQMLMVASNIPSKQGTFTKNICTCQWKQKIVSGNIGILAHIFISGTYEILVHYYAVENTSKLVSNLPFITGVTTRIKNISKQLKTIFITKSSC